MRTVLVTLMVAAASPGLAQIASVAAPAEPVTQDLLQLSKQKWLWMAERNTAELEKLFHPQSAFVHMGGTMTRAQELEVIRSGRIQYKKADVQDASVEIIGDTAIVLNRIRLVAVVGGSEVTNPFVVTEVYVRQGRSWKLGSMSFTRLLGN